MNSRRKGRDERLTRRLNGRRSKSHGGENEGAKARAAQQRREILSRRQVQRLEGDALDARMGLARVLDGPERLGWVFNLLPTTLTTPEGVDRAGVDAYCVGKGGTGTFKVTVLYDPYFYVLVSDARHLADAAVVLTRKYEDLGVTVETVEREDLDLANHLSGRRRRLLKLRFSTVSDLVECKMRLRPVVDENRARQAMQDAYSGGGAGPDRGVEDFLETLVDMREYDVPYVMRVSIDLDLRVGGWYIFTPENNGVSVTAAWQRDLIEVAEPKVLAFDIECTKAPLKFPQAEVDQVFMISYMIDGDGFLIISRSVVSKDVEDFEYTPKPAFPGVFTVFNEANEEALLRRFFDHCKEVRPQIYVTYNGDFFDWPFVDVRAQVYGMSLKDELGIEVTRQGEYRGHSAVHLDAFAWVNRDSYLPQGSRGLKHVTRYKLGYDPVEVDPEDMLPLAQSDAPEQMAHYSVSDAVATYYLYTEYVHNFIFSLATVIPLGPEDVLRKGSGTLCEALLMDEAFKGGILCPNKQSDGALQFHHGHLLESETYIGGHVECLETGIYRSDLATDFRLTPAAFDGLLDNLARDLRFALEVEAKVPLAEVTNYDEQYAAIKAQLEALRDVPVRCEPPLILHMDVAAMYPNIILTNRLQPDAVVSREDCAACDYNAEENGCKRPMEWIWRGEHTPASRAEFQQIRNQLRHEKVDGVAFATLPEEEQNQMVRERLKKYSHRVYRKTKVTQEESKVDVICQRENPFYVNAVRSFRDRRYDYKALTKQWKRAKAKADEEGDVEASKTAGAKAVLFDSLQLAHKCILNSFYGYVMRRGARWRSMPMAGIVTLTGANLIRQARELVEQIGRPLELDTDGIWCILPASFPQNFFFETRDGKRVKVEYPCAMLNADVHENYTNHQYQDQTGRDAFAMKSECSIFFELDGPYKAMVLPSSLEEGKLLKKRYAVFEDDGSLAELKGFELKRRGELEVIKTFQSQIFESGLFLEGESLEECYATVASVANHWLDVLDAKGEGVNDEELLDLVAERKTISRTVEEYGTQKSVALTAANRLADFLGSEMIKDRGLNCHLIISHLPAGAPVTSRAVPVVLFAAGVAEATRQKFLRRWLKDPSLTDVDLRKVIDWNYYKTRLGSTIQKIITIPAALQGLANPVPRVPHPEWLRKKVREQNSGLTQHLITDAFKKKSDVAQDLENLCIPGGNVGALGLARGGKVTRFRRSRLDGTESGGRGAPAGDGSDAGEGSAAAANDENRPPMAVDEPMDVVEKEEDEGPEIEEDFTGWLQHAKRGWRAIRKDLKEERTMLKRGFQDPARGGGGRGPTSDAAALLEKRQKAALSRDGVAGFLQYAQDRVAEGTLQLLEVRETDTAGVFELFALSEESALHRLRLTVDRTLYVNVQDAPASAPVLAALAALGAKATAKHLPHGAVPEKLFELRLPERRIVRGEQALAALLHHPQVRGVYELRLPLLEHAILELGSLIRVKRHRRQATLRDGVRLEDLERLPAPTPSYLVAPMRRLVLYHSRCERRSLSALITFSEPSPEGPSHVRAHLIYSHPSGKLANPPALSKLWRQLAADHPHLQASAKCTFTKVVVKTVPLALEDLHAALGRYTGERHGPTLALVLGSVPNSSWRRLLPVLEAFPVIHVPFHAEDNRYPALAWAGWASQRCLQRALLTAPWLSDRVEASRHGGIPLGNLGSDVPLSVADVAFARMLRHNRQVLWTPDAGNQGALAGGTPSIVQPGAYRTICVDIDVAALAVNAILAQPVLEEWEGASMLEGSDGPGTAHAFRILRLLVSQWLGDATAGHNAQSDAMLMHVYRWLCAPDATRRDAALRDTVHQLMTRVFLRLVAELKRLGATVVHADFQRIRIATKKTDLAKAQEYIHFVLETIQAMPVFSLLQMHATRYWEQLLFLDAENFGGLEAAVIEAGAVDALDEDSGREDEQDPSPETLDDDGMPAARASTAGPQAGVNGDRGFSDKNKRGDGDEDEDDEGDPGLTSRRRVAAQRSQKLYADSDEEEDAAGNVDDTDTIGGVPDGDIAEVAHAASGGRTIAATRIVSHWNLAEYLPPAVREYFLVLVGTFLLRPLRKAADLRAGPPLSEEELHQRLVTFTRDLVATGLTRRALDMLSDLVHHDTGPESFPLLAGSHRLLTNPGLEFVKAIATVLGLDRTCTDEVLVFRRLLLAELGLREFGVETEWADPSLSYVVTDVICAFCNATADLDLCRDPALCVVGGEEKWRCASCGHGYDVAALELRLVGECHAAIEEYQLQDRWCTKCKGLGVRVLAERCSCSGEYRLGEAEEAFAKRMRTLLRAAEFHGFEWLEETARHTLRLGAADEGGKVAGENPPDEDADGSENSSDASDESDAD